MTTVPPTLITYYLEMRTRAQFKPSYVDRPDLSLVTLSRVDVRYYRFLYGTVGEALRWRDRLLMPDDALTEALSHARVMVLHLGGVPAGYVELSARDPQGAIEMAYFGLRADYFGMGLGKHLLSVGIDTAWGLDATREWVHTCNLDHPHALENYQKRGFTLYDSQEEPMPARYV
jgi:GNAT superfamily N-acetyltransferase